MKTRLLTQFTLLLSIFVFSFSSLTPLSAQSDCTVSPIINMPPTYLGCPGDDISPDNTGMATATKGAGDCPDTLLVTYEDSFFTNTACEVLIKRSWTAKYGEETVLPLSSTREQVIWLSDDNAPSITNCPADVTIDEGNPVHTWTIPDVTDDCGMDTLYADYSSGHSFPIGTTLVTFTASDNCGNVANCSFSVAVQSQQCTNEFTLVCPPNYQGCRSESSASSNTGFPTIIRNSGVLCDSVQYSFDDQIILDNACNYRIERTWSATIPGSGVLKKCVQNIDLFDNTPPRYTNCPPDVTVETANTALNWIDPIFTDNCTNVTVVSNYNSGHIFPSGVTTVTYVATDGCGNQDSCSFLVTVQGTEECEDIVAISCPADYNGCIGDDYTPASIGMAMASYTSDFCDTIIFDYTDVVISNSACEKIIDRVWTATNPVTQLTKSCTQKINLKDDSAPIIVSCPSDITLDYNQRTYTWSAPTTNDDCGNVTLGASVDNGSTFAVGTTTVTYTATDECGNTSTCSFNVTVKDEVTSCDDIVAINCPSDYYGCRGEDYSPANIGLPVASFTPNFCDTIIFDYTDQVKTNTSCELKIDRIWTATNPVSGLVKTCTQKIRLTDTEAPSIYNCPNDVTLDYDDRQYTWTLPTANDNCSDITLSSSATNGATFPVGRTKVVYTARDACGNKSTCSFYVTVKDDDVESSLLVQCPSDIKVECGKELHLSKWPLPQVNSTCGDCDKDHSYDFVDMGSLEGHRYLCSKYKATWKVAAEKARQMGGYLAVINSSEENKLLSNFLEVRSAYIGLSDHSHEGHFKWNNGDPLNYTNWYPGQPNNYRGSQDYVELLKDGYWNDQYNYKELEFIVELPCIRIQQTKGPHSPKDFTGNTVIEYKVTDGCGNVATCSFNVSKSGGLTSSCNDDIHVQLAHGQYSKNVTWDEPTFQTCCSSGHSSGYGQEIPGYVYMGKRNGHKYYCSKEDLKWHDAQNECKKYGGYLAVINDKEENTMLANFLTVQSAYIGLSDHDHEGHFKWVNGDHMNYTNWYSRQPNNYYGTQHYVEMLSSGQWNDQYGHKKREYIMEIPGGVEVKQIAGPANGSSLVAGTYTVKYKITDGCGNTSLCSFKIKVKDAEVSYNDKCETGPTDSWHQWIESAQFGDFKKVSGNNGGYAHFDSHCIQVKRGEIIKVHLTSGTNHYGASQYWSIFIDWNKDGKYSIGERIARGQTKSALKGNFLFSESLPKGTFDLRISLNPHGYQSDGCERISHGEVEDYCITVSEGHGYVKGDAVQSKSNHAPSKFELEAHDLVIDEPLLENKQIEVESISIHPNPVSNELRISGSPFNEINIWNMNGQLARNERFSASRSRESLDISTLTPGVYLVEIQLNDGTFQIERVVKK